MDEIILAIDNGSIIDENKRENFITSFPRLNVAQKANCILRLHFKINELKVNNDVLRQHLYEEILNTLERNEQHDEDQEIRRNQRLFNEEAQEAVRLNPANGRHDTNTFTPSPSPSFDFSPSEVPTSIGSVLPDPPPGLLRQGGRRRRRRTRRRIRKSGKRSRRR